LNEGTHRCQAHYSLSPDEKASLSVDGISNLCCDVVLEREREEERVRERERERERKKV
jgi:hypothetical protein